MKKNAFTTIELIVSFSLTTVIALLMFQMIISLKNIYVKVGVKTSLLTKQSLISRTINRDLDDKTVTSLTSCGDSCIEIGYTDGTVKQLKIDKENNIISYGDDSFKISDSAYFGEESLTITAFYSIEGISYNAILNIKIPIYHQLYEGEDYGLNFVYQYNYSDANLDEVDF
ncbi:MAG: hypothetical protein PHE54_04610 [Bacilli bacterium]|nr:hypothetical protein [Bacilli bacterium]